MFLEYRNCIYVLLFKDIDTGFMKFFIMDFEITDIIIIITKTFFISFEHEFNYNRVFYASFFSYIFFFESVCSYVGLMH